MYRTTFSRLTTRYVNWELNLAYPPQPERIDYEIDVVFYRSDSSVFHRQSIKAHVDKSWTNSYRSWGTGWRQPRQWQTDLYRVELSIEGEVVASGEFEIVDSRIPVEGPFAGLTEALAWGSLPWSFEEELALLPLAGLMETDPKLASDAVSLSWVRESLTDEGTRVFQLLDVLAKEDIDLARRVIGLPWLADDITKDEWLALRTLTLLASRDAELAKFIADFEWLNDEITEDERRTIDALQDIAVEHPSLVGILLSLPWLSDQLTESEGLVIRHLRSLSKRDPQVAEQIAGMHLVGGFIRKLHRDTVWALWKLHDVDTPILSSLSAREWFTDSLSDDEAELIADLGFIARRSETAAISISRMPFLETFEPADTLATEALRRLASLKDDTEETDSEEPSEQFKRVMEHPNISDGITDEETKIVATLKGVSENNPGLVDTLLDSDKVVLEERTISLPLAGEVQLSIIRTRPGAERTMDLVENAVRSAEEFMGAPFPKRHVIYLFAEAQTPSYAGTNFGTNITSYPKVDDENEYSAESAFRHFAHEVSHYYWRGSDNDWIDEGPANFVSSIAVNAEYGHPISPEERPCVHASNIAELESLEPEQGEPEFSCNYSLGERIFHDLYRNMDDTAFRSGFRRLYLLSQIDDQDDDCEETKLTICHVEAAFKAAAPEGTAVTIEKVINRWYDGSEPYSTSHVDATTADPNLPDGVLLTQSYISLDKDRREETKIDRFSASDVLGKVRLYLHFSFPEVQEERELTLVLVEYYGDSFAYNVRDRTVTFRTGWTTSWHGTNIGPASGRKWAIGRYGVYVYHEGQKVAQVEYEVTP